jgi:hypothetical protein
VFGDSEFLGSHITKKLSTDNSIYGYSPSATRLGFKKGIMIVDATIEVDNELNKHII